MKILMLNASPRREGNVGRMLEAVRHEAEACGVVVEVLRVQELSVHPCLGCMKCRSTLRCVLPEDDAQRVLRLLQGCDGVVIGAPCYWGNMPGTLKLLLDRLVYGLMGESRRGVPVGLHRGKRAALLVTGTTPWPFNIWFRQTRGTVRALREVLRWSGFRIVRTLERGGTKHHPQLTSRDLSRCKALARALVRP